MANAKLILYSNSIIKSLRCMHAINYKMSGEKKVKQSLLSFSFPEWQVVHASFTHNIHFLKQTKCSLSSLWFVFFWTVLRISDLSLAKLADRMKPCFLYLYFKCYTLSWFPIPLNCPISSLSPRFYEGVPPLLPPTLAFPGFLKVSHTRF